MSTAKEMINTWGLKKYGHGGPGFDYRLDTLFYQGCPTCGDAEMDVVVYLRGDFGHGVVDRRIDSLGEVSFTDLLNEIIAAQ